MHTIIDKINNSFTLQQRIDAAKMVEVLHEGLFGAYHYKFNEYEFKQVKVHSGRYSPTIWIMTKNGKEYAIKYKYAFYLTMKNLGFIN